MADNIFKSQIAKPKKEERQPSQSVTFDNPSQTFDAPQPVNSNPGVAKHQRTEDDIFNETRWADQYSNPTEFLYYAPDEDIIEWYSMGDVSDYFINNDEYSDYLNDDGTFNASQYVQDYRHGDKGVTLEDIVLGTYNPEDLTELGVNNYIGSIYDASRYARQGDFDRLSSIYAKNLMDDLNYEGLVANQNYDINRISDEIAAGLAAGYINSGGKVSAPDYVTYGNNAYGNNAFSNIQDDGQGTSWRNPYIQDNFNFIEGNYSPYSAFYDYVSPEMQSVLDEELYDNIHDLYTTTGGINYNGRFYGGAGR